MNRLSNQRGVALFTVVFLIVVVGGLAVTLSLISGQQQLTTVQTLEQTSAYYAARARVEEEIANLLDGNPCTTSSPDFNGFTTAVDVCKRVPIDEGVNADADSSLSAEDDYYIYDLEVRAYRGNANSGTLVQRSIRVQITDAP